MNVITEKRLKSRRKSDCIIKNSRNLELNLIKLQHCMVDMLLIVQNSKDKELIKQIKEVLK